jgi:hypothetical protein
VADVTFQKGVVLGKQEQGKIERDAAPHPPLNQSKASQQHGNPKHALWDRFENKEGKA